jgi:hypothetical protein
MANASNYPIRRNGASVQYAISASGRAARYGRERDTRRRNSVLSGVSSVMAWLADHRRRPLDLPVGATDEDVATFTQSATEGTPALLMRKSM